MDMASTYDGVALIRSEGGKDEILKIFDSYDEAWDTMERVSSESGESGNFSVTPFRILDIEGDTATIRWGVSQKESIHRAIGTFIESALSHKK